MATITLKAGMVWKGAYDASATYDKLDVVRNADKTQIAVCKQGGSGIPLTNSNYWEVSIDASGIIALLEDALAHGEIYTMKIGSVTTGATSSATIVNNHQTHETILNLVLEKGEKGDKGDKGDRGEKGDTVIIGEGEEYTLYNELGEHTDGAMTQAAVTEEFEKLDEVYARNDGYYESMGVGTATNLKGQNAVDAEFAYRKSGGNVEVQDGNAMIEAIKGNTIAWNQLVTPHKIDSSKPFRSDVTNVVVTDGIVATTCIGTTAAVYERGFIVPNVVESIIGHKYLICMQIKASVNRRFSFSDFGSGNSIPTQRPSSFVADTWQYYYGIATVETTSVTSSKTLLIRVEQQQDIGEVFYSKELNFFDLTLIYGSGKEPATPEQFEQDYFNWFGKPLTYEPYDAGSLHNTKVSALKTTGFNLWDEEWELGNIEPNNGSISIDNSRIRSKNFISVINGQTYYFQCGANKEIGVFAYDADKNYIGAYYGGSWVASNAGTSNVTGTAISVPANCSYIKFRVVSAYGTTYNNDICINISDPNRNGEYEPYKESTLPLDVSTLTGKLNGEGSSVVVFADGMNRAGDVHDEIKIENGVVKAIKRVGKMDLGSPNWFYDSNKAVFRTAINQPTVSSVPNLVCSKYAIGTNKDSEGWAESENKTIFRGLSSSAVIVKDTSYIGTAAFKDDMVGEKLCYELKEPEVYVLDDFSLPKLYPVANGGTEEQLSNSPNSLPATLSIRYGLNAAAFIQNAPKNYISKESMTNFLSNLGSAMGGTWSMVWNSSTNKYDFSFTQNRSVDVEQPIEDK